MTEVYKAFVSFRGQINLTVTINNLLSVRQRMLFEETVFKPWLSVQCLSGDPMLVHLLLQHRVDQDDPTVSNELRFRVAGHEVRFRRQEFCLVTGLRFGPYDLDESGLHIRGIPIRGRLFPHLEEGVAVKISNILEIFRSPNFNEMDDMDVVRICLLMLVEVGFLGKQKTRIVSDHMLRLVEDITAWNCFPWGSYLWEETVKQLHIFSQKDKEKYLLGGFAWAFKIWIFEAFPFARHYARKESWDVVIPRAIAWEKKTRNDIGWENCLLFLTVDTNDVPHSTLTPTVYEANTCWWQDSVRFFDDNVDDLRRRVVAMEEVVYAKDAQIASLEHTVSMRDGDIAAFQSLLLSRDQHIASLERTVLALQEPQYRPQIPILWPPGGIITLDWVKTLMLTLNWSSKNLLPSGLPAVLPVELIDKLLLTASGIFGGEDNCVTVEADRWVGSSVVVVGDVHGQLHDLLFLLKDAGYPCEERFFVFNGDYVDRGAWGLETWLILLAWKIFLPHRVFLLRGNHETLYCTQTYGFQNEVLMKYGMEAGSQVYHNCLSCFTKLPLASIIARRVYTSHGGLFRMMPPEGVKRKQNRKASLGLLKHLQAASRYELDPGFDGKNVIAGDVMWSDPHPKAGLSRNVERGVGLLWGPDCTENFLKTSGLKLIIRSHEGPDARHGHIHFGGMDDGYTIDHIVPSGKLITVFSAPDYPQFQATHERFNNKGAYVVLESPNFEPVFHSFDAVIPRPMVTAYYDVQNAPDSDAEIDPTKGGADSETDMSKGVDSETYINEGLEAVHF